MVREHLLLSGLLILACAFSVQLAWRLKITYKLVNVMWHDDWSLCTSVFLLFIVIAAVPIYLNFHPDMNQISKLQKFDHFTEFDKQKEADPKF